MSDAAPSPNHALKIKALELANQHNAPPKDVVERAGLYHGFLAGAAPAAGATKGATAGATTTAATNKATTAPPKGATAGATTTKATTTKATTTAPKTNPKAATPNKPAATTQQGAPSAEGLVMEDVSKALQKVLAAAPDRDTGKANAYKILKDVGGVTSVRELKPALYKAAIDACDKALAAPAGGEAVDDFGGDAGAAPISANEEVDTDPPEETGSGQNAEDM
jgi:hypothetical protein